MDVPLLADWATDDFSTEIIALVVDIRSDTASPPTRDYVMQLTPRHPPGHKSRKARAFASEIRRLRALGYTTEAIREALADVGVTVSVSTVLREARRNTVPVVDTNLHALPSGPSLAGETP